MPLSVYSIERFLLNAIKNCIEIRFDDIHLGYSKYCKIENDLTVILNSMLENIKNDYDGYIEFYNHIKYGDSKINLARKLDIYFRKQQNNHDSLIYNYYDRDKTIENFKNKYEMLIKEFERLF